MAQNRGDKLRHDIKTLEDAILYAESKGEGDLEEAKHLLARIQQFFDQGTWSQAEKLLSQTQDVKEKGWYLEFIEKRDQGKYKSGEQQRFQDDGLCPKYGHIMVKVKLSNVRWFYECRICKKTGKSHSIK
jgi:hypothetical protein